MTRIVFKRQGRDPIEVEAGVGACLLHVAQDAGQPLEGTCGGQMACGTCHVTIDLADWPRLDPPSADEEDMLDLVRGAIRTSRLACQVAVPEGEVLSVTVIG